MNGLAKTGMMLAVTIVAMSGVSELVLAKGPSIELSLKCPELRYVGRSATVEVTVTNSGDAPAEDLVVTDLLSKGVEFRTADNQGRMEGGNVVWRLGSLAPGQTRTLTTTVGCPTIGKFKTSATAVYCAAAAEECEMEVKGIPAILLECVDDPDPIETGTNVNYTMTVTNQGSAVGTNITLTCTLPAELEYVSSRGPTTAQAQGRKIAFPPLATLAPKAKAVYTITAKGVGEGDVRFQVELNSDQIGVPVMETESTRVYE